MESLDAELPLDDFQTRDPQPCRLVVAFGLLAVVSLQVFIIGFGGGFAVAVVRLVVQHDVVLHAHQFWHEPLQHLPLGFTRVEFFAVPLQQRPPASRQFQAFSQLEPVEVRDDDLRLLNFGQKIAGNQFAIGVVAVGVVGLKDPQCWSRRAVSGVTCHSDEFCQARHRATKPRTSLMTGVGSYSCCWVDSPCPSSKTRLCWVFAPYRFLGFGIGVMKSAGRRVGIFCSVCYPWSSSSQCRPGQAYGELRIGCSKKGLLIAEEGSRGCRLNRSRCAGNVTG